MKKSTLKSTLDSELPPKISVHKGKDLQQLDEEKLEQIYPKAKPPVVITYQRTVKLTVEVPFELSKKVKMKCLNDGITMKQFVQKLLEELV